MEPRPAFFAAATAALLGSFAVRGAVARKALALAVAAAAGVISLGGRLEAARADRPERPRDAILEGTVGAVVRNPGGLRIDLHDVQKIDPASANLPRRIRLYVETRPDRIAAIEEALPGDRLRVRARLRTPGGARNPGRRSDPRSLERAGIGAVARLVHPALVARRPDLEGIRPLRTIHRLRARVSQRLAALGPRTALLRVLGVGDRGGLDGEARLAFARLGIAHLLAVSGLHVLFVASFVYWIAFLGLRRWGGRVLLGDVRRWALLVAWIGCGLYAIAAGWGVPVRRAWICLSALVAVALRGRASRRGPALAAAAIVILGFEPEALFLPGAQMSFAATVALACLLGTEPWHPCESPWVRARQALGRIVRTSATALLATSPLAAWHFGTLAPLGLVANAVAIPWTALVLLPLALASVAMASLPPSGLTRSVLVASARVAYASQRTVLDVAGWLPDPSPGVAPGALWWAVALVIVALAFASSNAIWRIAGLGLFGLVLAIAPAPAIAPSPPRAIVLDVGQGSATVVQGETGSILVDAGAARVGVFDRGREVVAPALAALGIRELDLLVVSHGDLDHRGGAPGVLESLPVGAVWLPYGARDDADFARLVETARKRGIPVRETGAQSASARFGDLEVKPLWPPRDPAPRARNDRSLVVRVETADRRLLLPGDISAASEAALVTQGRDLAADLLVLAHHGSRSSSSPRFLEAVGASVAVATAPCTGRFEMPHRRVVSDVRRAGAALWWTGRDGAVLVGLGQPLWVRAWNSIRCQWPGGSSPTLDGTQGGTQSAHDPEPVEDAGVGGVPR